MRFLLVVVFVLAFPSAAAADDGDGVSANMQPLGIEVGASDEVSLGEQVPGSETNGQPVAEGPFLGTEIFEAFCGGVNFSESCAPSAGTPPQQVTGGMVATAFQFVPLSPSTLIIQPPNGRTLVNFDTNFYTDAADEQIIPVPLLNQIVELRVWPASFTWNFGDGESMQTTERGAAYPALDITHRYLSKGDVAPSLDTTYAAEWRLQGAQAWQPVDGTVTITGEPSALRVLTATPTLVG